MNYKYVLKVIVFVLGLTIFPYSSFIASAENDSDTDWIKNGDVLLFYEGLIKVDQYSIETKPTRWIVYNALKEYLGSIDPFCKYLTPKEYSSYQMGKNPLYAGVGMEILRNDKNQVICIPFSNSPADYFGIKYKDVLVKVDGVAINKKSIDDIGNMIRGKINSPVYLTIKKPDNLFTTYKINRTKQNFLSTTLKQLKPLPIIKISSFSNQTSQELKKILNSVGKGIAKIIDLRGNTGGDMFSAIDAAALFLDPNTKIGTLKFKNENKAFYANEDPIDRKSKIFIWQDEYTASAAEIFIVALTENQRAESIGKKTFGKGVAQKIVELSDGSAMFVTYSEFFGPNGNSYHKIGLNPKYEIPKDTSNEDFSYAEISLALLQ